LKWKTGFKVQITPSKILGSSDSVKSQGLMLSLLAISVVTGLKNNYFNAIKVKTKVMRSQRYGKDNAKMKYCRLVAAW
jgi:hypothetical protein